MARNQKRSKYAKSLNKQMHDRMQELNRIGVGKHEAKQVYRHKHEGANPAKAYGIHSINTYEAYKQTSMAYVAWMKEHYPEVKHMDDMRKTHVIEYLQEKRDNGQSAWSLSRDMSGLNKILGMDVTKKEASLPKRSYKETTRSREPKEHDRKYNPDNYRKQIDVAQSFGVRRESINGGDYQLKEGSIYKADGKIYAAVIEKGGRFRNVPCLESMEGTMEEHFPHMPEHPRFESKEHFQEAYEKMGRPLFDRYTSKIDNHAFRAEYARHLYEEYKGKLGNPKEDYRNQYDERVLRGVSHALGHSRPSVVAEYYMR